MIAEPLLPLARPVDGLKFLPGNPRRGDVAACKRSLKRFGQRKPIVVREDGTVEAGNTTLQAALELGWPEIACVAFGDDDATAKAFALADNRTSELGSFDAVALLAMASEVDAVDPELLLAASYDLAELTGTRPGQTDPDAVPEPPSEPVTVPGDVWVLGEHRLLCGDATDPADVARLMDGESASLLVTDPPYGVSYADKNRFLNAIDRGNRIQEPILGDHERPEDMAGLWNAAFATVRPVLAPGAAYYVTGPQGGDLLLLLLSLRDSGFPLRHMLIWAKNNHVLGRSDYNYKHEPIIYGWVEGSHKFHGPAGEVSLWEINKPLKSDLHPTMKPVELFTRAIRNSSARGDIVLDPFGGSGTTVIACYGEGRRARVLELEPAYVDVICRRFQGHTGTKPVLEATGEPHDFTA